MHFDLDNMTDEMKRAQRERSAEFDRRVRSWRWKWRIVDGVFIAGIIAALAWIVLSVGLVLTSWSPGIK